MLKLVPFSPTVFDALFNWQNDDELRKQMGGLSVPLREEELKFFYQQFLTGNTAILGVSTESGTIIGAFMMENVHKRHGRLEMHFVFDKKFRRHAKEGFQKFFDYVFKEHGFDWVHVYVPETNEPCRNILQKLGALQRCVIPDYFRTAEGLIAAKLYSLHKGKLVREV